MSVSVKQGDLELRIETYEDHSVVIHVCDKVQLLGRLLVGVVDVAVWQPNDVGGPTIEWVGLPSAEW